MDCKKALVECNGDYDAAVVFLRNKGLASADKKGSRVAAEGLVVSYIHAGSRLGVLAEVNCETDFVARGAQFREFAEDVAMQAAANMDVAVRLLVACLHAEVPALLLTVPRCKGGALLQAPLTARCVLLCLCARARRGDVSTGGFAGRRERRGAGA